MESGDPLADNPFSFVASKAGSVMIYANGRLARTLKGREAARFLSRADAVADRDPQLLMARTTGKFKFGNER